MFHRWASQAEAFHPAHCQVRVQTRSPASESQIYRDSGIPSTPAPSVTGARSGPNQRGAGQWGSSNGPSSLWARSRSSRFSNDSHPARQTVTRIFTHPVAQEVSCQEGQGANQNQQGKGKPASLNLVPAGQKNGLVRHTGNARPLREQE